MYAELCTLDRAAPSDLTIIIMFVSVSLVFVSLTPGVSVIHTYDDGDGIMHARQQIGT